MVRELIGLVSIAIGLLLLASSLYLRLRRAYARLDGASGRGALVLLVYGFLFVIVGIVIERTTPSSRVAARTEHPPLERSATSPQAVTPSTDQAVSEAEGDKTHATDRPELSHQEREKKAKQPVHRREPVSPTPSVPTTEDRVYVAVEGFLKRIEDFFERYGTPVNTELSSEAVVGVSPIFFDDTTADIPARYYPLLNKAARYIREHPETGVIEVQSHTNGEGPEVYNFLITQSRANSVRDYLIARGIEPARLVAKGYGTSRPFSSMANSTKPYHNRRIEFVPVSITQSVPK
jgi:outer membrane protein OmpA-like peptidoglycan-associated protein